MVVGSGAATRALLEDRALLDSLRLDPSRQLIASQCSGALLLAKLGLLEGMPACTDLGTRPWLEKAGVTVLDRAFVAHGNLATAGGCLASQYLSAWILARLAGIAAATEALRYVAPVGEKDQYVGRILENIRPHLPAVVASASWPE